LLIEFLPYRIYDIEGTRYFEFFSFPYDRHRNPSSKKGVIFDTNRSYDENAVWEMMEKRRVAAYGKTKHVVEYLSEGDIIFFYHRGLGLVAAGEVQGGVRQDEGAEQYREIRFLTPVPDRRTGLTKAMPASEITRITGRNFFWARTIKVPYLSYEEAEGLVAELKEWLQSRI